MSRSAVMVFSKDVVNGCWKWGEYSLPIVSSYSYLVVLGRLIDSSINNRLLVMSDYRFVRSVINESNCFWADGVKRQSTTSPGLAVFWGYGLALRLQCPRATCSRG